MNKVFSKYGVYGYIGAEGDTVECQVEKAILGGLMIDPKRVSQAAQWIKPEHFSIPEFSQVYTAILELWQDGKQVDDLTVCYHLIRKGEYPDLNAVKWIAFLSQRVTGCYHLETYAGILLDQYARNQLASAAITLSTANSPTASTMDILNSVRSTIDSIGEGTEVDEEPMSETWNRVLNEPPKEPPMKMGMGEMDNMCGIARGSLNLIAAYQGTGKTAFAINVALNVAERGKKVWFVSVEMSPDDLVRRAQSIYSGIDGMRLFNGDTTSAEIDIISHMGIGHNNVIERISVDQRGEMDLMRFMATAERKAKEGCDLIIVDYVQLLTADAKLKTEYDRVTAISHGLRRTARVLGVPILGVSQLRKADKAETNPTMNDIRSTGQLAQDASVILLLSRSVDAKGEPTINVNVAKNRNGPTGEINLEYTPNCFRIGPRAIRTPF